MWIRVAIAVDAYVPYSAAAIALRGDLADEYAVWRPNPLHAIRVTYLLSSFEGSPCEEFVPSITESSVSGKRAATSSADTSSHLPKNVELATSSVRVLGGPRLLLESLLRSTSATRRCQFESRCDAW